MKIKSINNKYINKIIKLTKDINLYYQVIIENINKLKERFSLLKKYKKFINELKKLKK